MNRIIASLKDKRFRYGSFSTAMILFTVAVFVLVNLVAGQLNISKDLTSDQMYSLSKYSKEYLAGLEQDVTIYALFKTGQENLMFKQLLDEYEAASPRVTVVYKDPVLYPTFVEQYAKPDEKVSDNSVIVVSGSKSKVVAYEDMYTQEFSYETFSYNLTSIDFEPQISKAIYNVTSGDAPVIYRVTGNNEYLPENLVKQIQISNYEVRDVDLVTGDIPEDCDMLLITLPARDWSTDEADRILKYLQNDGKAMFALGYAQERFPNMESVLAAYGVALGDYIVLEGDANYYYMNNPYMVIPQFVPGDITQSAIDKKYAALLYQSTGVQELAVKKTSTKIEPFLITSAAAYGKSNPESESVNKEPNDVSGPFNLGVTVTDTFYTDTTHTTKLVVLSCELIMEESINNAIGGTNWDIFINSINWMQEQATGIYIPSKSPSSSAQLQLTQAQAGMTALVSVIVLPLVLIATGFVIWLRRRHS